MQGTVQHMSAPGNAFDTDSPCRRKARPQSAFYVTGWRQLLRHVQVGGCKAGSAAVTGDGAYGRLKFEAGIHRVQRVPVTEKSGRVHTSAAAVSVLPQADEVLI